MGHGADPADRRRAFAAPNAVPRARESRAPNQVVEASDGEAGLALFDKTCAALVITDIFMPEREGLETIIAIRARDTRVPVIAMSGGGCASDFDPLEMAAGLRADFVIAKPFPVGELLGAVNVLLEGSAGGPSPKVRRPRDLREDQSRAIGPRVPASHDQKLGQRKGFLLRSRLSPPA
jgi:DNA-binding response OmpR family regulator